MGRSLVWLLAIALTLTVVGCGGGKGTPAVEPTPTPTPSIPKDLNDAVPTSEPLPTSDVPQDYKFYTDQINGFSIHTPQSWERILFSEPQPAGPIFSAGHPTELGFLPNISILRESVPSESSVFEVYEVAKRATEKSQSGFMTLSEVITTVGERPVVIADLVFDVNSSERARMVMLVAISERGSWIIACAVSIGQPATPEDLETCNTVLRSLRIF